MDAGSPAPLALLPCSQHPGHLDGGPGGCKGAGITGLKQSQESLHEAPLAVIKQIKTPFEGQ